MTIKSTVGSLKENPIGLIVGGVALYFGAKKLMKVENKYALIGIVLAGAIAGAMIQSKMKSKAALASTVKK